MSAITIKVKNNISGYIVKLMKFLLNSILYLLVFVTFENVAYSLSDKQIKEICQKKPRRLSCIKNLKLKNLNLMQGNRIEIPVIPFKK